MSQPNTLLNLLRRYDELLAQGQSPTPEEVCKDHPNLLDAFRRSLKSANTTLPSDPHVTAPSSVETPRVPAASPFPQIAGFTILAPLGRGGMGVVYKARQHNPDRLVALKTMRYALPGSHDLARFQIEANAAAQLKHPNIVQIHAVGENDGLPYFCLEYVDGGTLAKKISGTPQPANEAAQLVETLARAMHAAHQGGIVHRDLKPGNVLLTADGTPKISDFGLAKRLEEPGLTMSGIPLGTPSYMAPEQAEGAKEIGPQTDVYGLGAILYELLTGRPPFRGQSSQDTMDQVRSQEPVPPRALQPKTPQDLESICLKCLRKSPRQRYVSTQQLGDELHRHLNQEPLRHTRPVGKIERLRLWRRRNSALATASALSATVLLGLTVFGVVFGFYQYQAAQQLSREREAIGVALGDTKNRLAEAEKDRGQLERLLKEAKAERAADDEKKHAAERLGSAILHLDLGLSLCGKGKVAEGLLWLAHSLELAPPDAEDVRRVARVNLFAWRQPIPRPKSSFPERGQVRALSFGADGKWGVTSSAAGGILWNVEKAKAVRQLSSDKTPIQLAFFHRPNKLLTIQANKALFWDLSEATEIKKTWGGASNLTLPGGSWGALSISPDSKTVFASDHDIAGVAGRGGLFDTEKDARMRSLEGLSGFVRVAAFSPDGTTLLTACHPPPGPGLPLGHVQLWESATGKPLGSLPKCKGTILALSFAPDGKSFFVGIRGEKGAGLIQQWSVTTLQPLGLTVDLQVDVKSMVFSPDSRTVLTVLYAADSERWGLLWDRSIGKPLSPFLALGKSGLPSAVPGPPDLDILPAWLISDSVFSPDGRLLMTGGEEVAHLWEVPTPLSGSVERIALWAQVNAGAEFAGGIVRPLDPATLEQKKKRLADLGGPP